MTYYTFGNLKSRLATTFSFAILGIYVYNNYDSLPSFNDIKVSLFNKFTINKTIKDTSHENNEDKEVNSNLEDQSGNLFSDSV